MTQPTNQDFLKQTLLGVQQASDAIIQDLKQFYDALQEVIKSTYKTNELNQNAAKEMERMLALTGKGDAAQSKDVMNQLSQESEAAAKMNENIIRQNAQAAMLAGDSTNTHPLLTNAMETTINNLNQSNLHLSKVLNTIPYLTGEVTSLSQDQASVLSNQLAECLQENSQLIKECELLAKLSVSTGQVQPGLLEQHVKTLDSMVQTLKEAYQNNFNKKVEARQTKGFAEPSKESPGEDAQKARRPGA